LISGLDAAIQADAALAELPGRFWFSLDDGHGDVSGLGADVGAHFLDVDSAALLVAGVDSGVRMSEADVIDTLVFVARRFVAERGKAWRTKELVDPSALTTGLTGAAEPGATWPPEARPPVGWIGQADGLVALGAAVPLGELPARTAQYLAAIDAPLVVTPWRSVLVCDLEEGVADVALRVLAPLGLVFDANSPWLEVSACTGSPGCAKSIADVRHDAAEAAQESVGFHRHFVGCDRACGSPPSGEVLVATPDGYQPRHT
jgi:precorrin-3B synthase